MSSEGIEALDGLARDADAERKRMMELLREKGPEYVRTLRSEAREQLAEVKKQLVKAREKVEEEVLHITEKYGPEASEEERKEAARRAARGHGSDLFAEAVGCLRAQAEEATDLRWREVYAGRHRHIMRLLRELHQKQERCGDLKFRLRAVKHLLEQWTAGELDLGHVEVHPDVEAVARLLDPSRRLEYIDNVLFEQHGSWGERYDALKAECERLGLDVPYESARSMSKAYNQYVKRRK